jgi:hypothetical protein
MARHTFFSFHYERDVWRAGQVRNCNLLPSEDQHGFIDSVEWESIRRQGDEAIERWIADQLIHTTVTAVLIGAETAERPWVLHEIIQSWNRGNALVGVRIHNIKDQHRATDSAGKNPFDLFELPDGALASSVFKTYDWVLDAGRDNLGKWSEEAVGARSKYAANSSLTRRNSASKIEKINFIPGAATSSSFTPRSPWCPDHVAGGR